MYSTTKRNKISVLLVKKERKVTLFDSCDSLKRFIMRFVSKSKSKSLQANDFRSLRYIRKLKLSIKLSVNILFYLYYW